MTRSLPHNQSVAAEALPDLVPEILDPARLAELPSSERLPVYKQYLRAENHRLRKAHDEGGGGCVVAGLRAEVVDGLLRSLLGSALLQAEGTSSLALVANGGYGRGLLNPGSDIDLLFLLPQASHKLDKHLKKLVEEILYPLFDLGFKVGHASRSIPECVAEARRDPITRTSLFDHRRLCGSEPLYDKFVQRFRQECILKDRARFFEERRSDIDYRYRK